MCDTRLFSFSLNVLDALEINFIKNRAKGNKRGKAVRHNINSSYHIREHHTNLH